MTISLSKFVEDNIGKSLANPDGSYPGQCVSLVQQYLYQCLDIPFAPRGNAKDWVNLPETIANRTYETQKAGDIIVFPNAGVVNGVTYGHIGVVISENEIFEQNVSPIIVAQKTAFTTAINRSGSYVLMRPVANITDSGNTSSITGYGLYTSKAGVYIRESASTSANVKTLVPKGNELKIKYFIDGFQGDG